MREYLDPNNYVFAAGFPIQRNRDLVLPSDLVLSPNMLVRWTIRQMARGVTITDIPQAVLSSTLEIPGFGLLSADEYSISPSIQGQERVQIISIDPTLPNQIKLTQISDLITNSVLEFYTYTGSEIDNMGVSNPISIDANALAQAMGSQVGASMQQALASNALALEAKSSKTDEGKIKPWSGNIENHKILDLDLNRLGVHCFHPGKNLNAQNTSDVFIVAGSPEGRDQNKYDYVMNMGGEYNSDPNKETLPLYAWVAATAPTTRITVTRYFSAAPTPTPTPTPTP